MQNVIRAIVLSAMVFVASPLIAQQTTERSYYGVSISGFPIGHVEFDASTEDGLYQVQGFMGSSGFFGFFIGTRYSGAVIGEIQKSTAAPRVFRGRFEARGKFAQVDMRYAKGQPSDIEHQPPRTAQTYDVAASTTRGSVDPITALYLLLREVNARDICKFDQMVFDGVRLSRVSVSSAQDDEGNTVCNGVYRRIGGFSDEQLQEGTDYPFRLEYAEQASGKFQVTRFLATTDFGIAKATLRNR